MKGWQIFTHSVRLVFNNLGAALQVSLVLYLVQVISQVHVWLYPPVMGDFEPGTMPGTMPDINPGTMFTSFILGIAALVASLWIAVAWHRFVLTEEYPQGWLPRWHGANLWGYFGRSIMIGLIVALAAIVASIPLGLIAVGLPFLAPLVPLVVIGVAALVFLRLCVMLPGAAVGRSIGLAEAWETTKGEAPTLLTLAALVIGASIVIQLPSLISGDPTSTVNLVYGLVVNWFATIIGISVLTTLYGHFVEGRPVD